METARSRIEFNEIEGGDSTRELTVYALSTCAFCKRAMQYLRDSGLAYRYVYLDQLDFDLKREVKSELKEQYGDIKLFPILTIDGSEILTGFTKAKWAETLGLPVEEEGS
jgi:glutaredoxin